MAFQEQASNVIRTAGGRMTAQRQLIIDLLAVSNDAIDADQLYQSASAQDASISLTTVYRTLNTLEEAQLIISRYVSSDHQRKTYRIRADNDETFHFTCRNCGRVTPFQSDLISHFRRELGTQLGAEVLTLCMCAGGLCADCREEETTMTLDQWENGQAATVRKIAGQGALRRRLMDMGLSKGVSIEMVKTAPMGDPVEYLVRGYHLSLRKSEARLVEVELC